jgi:dienelactone hydrolase/pimeloyl-ACP methyl ester carboxylesterase
MLQQPTPKTEDLFGQFLRAEAKKLREKDEPPKSRDEWLKRRSALRDKMYAAMGSFPDKPCELEPRLMGVLNRTGYRIEKRILQSRPNVWITATAYVPELKEGQKAPAVLVVHGHWPWARRDPVVQARCLGLVKLGFFVLAVDAFGAGERYTAPAKGAYHGALYGATLWPTGNSLLGMQVYDNRRAVDYILSRPEVNGKLGITGASGGGNQSMYAGSLDERFNAVVPVCSVGNYQAYLKTACCVCEVLPGALQFTEEGDVLGLVAPRGLMVINAAKDGVQFSPAEAEKSVARAKSIFSLYGVEQKLRHEIFDSGHDYNQKMRETMYGFMTLHLKGEGKGEPIPEPKLDIEKVEDLACFPDPNDRPKGFFFPPSYAAAEAKVLIEKMNKIAPDHPEMWESASGVLSNRLLKILGPISAEDKLVAEPGKTEVKGEIRTTPFVFKCEGDLPLSAITCGRTVDGKLPMCLALHPGGAQAALDHPLSAALVAKGTQVLALDVRGYGATKPSGGAIGGAPDHHVAEYGVWIGRPLLGQWLCDVLSVLTWARKQPGLQPPFFVAGFGPMGVTALLAGALFPNHVSAVATVDSPVSYMTDTAYAAQTPMGMLVPGILKVGDIPHLAGLAAPRRLIIVDGVSPNGKKLSEKELKEAYAFTTEVYKATKSSQRLTIGVDLKWSEVIG